MLVPSGPQAKQGLQYVILASFYASLQSRLDFQVFATNGIRVATYLYTRVDIFLIEEKIEELCYSQ